MPRCPAEYRVAGAWNPRVMLCGGGTGHTQCDHVDSWAEPSTNRSDAWAGAVFEVPSVAMSTPVSTTTLATE
jgi:hypothetical protein